ARRGVVVLPTGAGKTLLGALAIAQTLRRTLVLVPTIVLCAQWRDELLRLLDLPPAAVGIVGGGRREWICPVVAATYDGAARALADKGYLAPFDEVLLTVDLGAEDRAAHDRDMGVFRAYRERTARAGEPALAFLERVRKRSTFDATARAALLAYQRARTLALT